MASRDDARAHRHRDERSSHQDTTRSSTRRQRGRRSQSPGSSRRRSRSPHRRPHAAAQLPFSARQLSKTELPVFRSLFGYYLSVQKQIELEDIDEREIKGRWKSFVGKWNRGELAEGWYDPEMFARISAESRQPRMSEAQEDTRVISPNQVSHQPAREDDQGDSGDDYGPVPPPAGRVGPGAPSLQDLEHRDELLEVDRANSRSALQSARKADRALQKERLDNIAPRADAGTRERKLENRAAVNAKMREFRDRSPGAMEANEREVMGDDGVDEYKRMKKEQERKKSEREIRREEMDRARQEEMEEKRRKWREREEGTVNMLKQLAKERFG
ncbi:uncharacterized protein F5Z01DRAFT_86590 [Emericellopsis atlantica]|uniref:RNA helicase HEL117 n=1 Tax=Emericellopsis atlantica TaxID=2614577 RepID=A0A9P8CPB1_9HYPO|nr:uncharacterized protein F5Z01DRAFT_86590 [Emericellopsis atlantica]KAG9254669.1 hypothetical protein F5Z01DRAFT_86590 [Emericellopsis atlantica]